MSSTDIALNVIGIVANILNVIYNIPLVWKPFKSRSVENISVYFIILRFVCITLWIIYGIIKRDIYYIILNIVSLTSSILLILMLILNKFKLLGFGIKKGISPI